MEFERFTAEPSPESIRGLVGASRILAWAKDPLGSNAIVRAWVGDEELVCISIDQIGLTFEGYMSAPPSDTDTLQVQIDAGDKIDTGLTVDSDPPIA